MSTPAASLDLATAKKEFAERKKNHSGYVEGPVLVRSLLERRSNESTDQVLYFSVAAEPKNLDLVANILVDELPRQGLRFKCFVLNDKNKRNTIQRFWGVVTKQGETIDEQALRGQEVRISIPGDWKPHQVRNLYLDLLHQFRASGVKMGHASMALENRRVVVRDKAGKDSHLMLPLSFAPTTLEAPVASASSVVIPRAGEKPVMLEERESTAASAEPSPAATESVETPADTATPASEPVVVLVGSADTGDAGAAAASAEPSPAAVPSEQTPPDTTTPALSERVVTLVDSADAVDTEAAASLAESSAAVTPQVTPELPAVSDSLIVTFLDLEHHQIDTLRFGEFLSLQREQRERLETEESFLQEEVVRMREEYDALALTEAQRSTESLPTLLQKLQAAIEGWHATSSRLPAKAVWQENIQDLQTAIKKECPESEEANWGTLITSLHWLRGALQGFQAKSSHIDATDIATLQELVRQQHAIIHQACLNWNTLTRTQLIHNLQTLEAQLAPVQQLEENKERAQGVVSRAVESITTRITQVEQAIEELTTSVSQTWVNVFNTTLNTNNDADQESLASTPNKRPWVALRNTTLNTNNGVDQESLVSMAKQRPRTIQDFIRRLQQLQKAQQALENEKQKVAQARTAQQIHVPADCGADDLVRISEQIKNAESVPQIVFDDPAADTKALKRMFGLTDLQQRVAIQLIETDYSRIVLNTLGGDLPTNKEVNAELSSTFARLRTEALNSIRDVCHVSGSEVGALLDAAITALAATYRQRAKDVLYQEMNVLTVDMTRPSLLPRAKLATPQHSARLELQEKRTAPVVEAIQCACNVDVPVAEALLDEAYKEWKQEAENRDWKRFDTLFQEEQTSLEAKRDEIAKALQEAVSSPVTETDSPLDLMLQLQSSLEELANALAKDTKKVSRSLWGKSLSLVESLKKCCPRNKATVAVLDNLYRDWDILLDASKHYFAERDKAVSTGEKVGVVITEPEPSLPAPVFAEKESATDQLGRLQRQAETLRGRMSFLQTEIRNAILNLVTDFSGATANEGQDKPYWRSLIHYAGLTPEALQQAIAQKPKIMERCYFRLMYCVKVMRMLQEVRRAMAAPVALPNLTYSAGAARMMQQETEASSSWSAPILDTNEYDKLHFLERAKVEQVQQLLSDYYQIFSPEDVRFGDADRELQKIHDEQREFKTRLLNKRVQIICDVEKREAGRILSLAHAMEVNQAISGGALNIAAKMVVEEIYATIYELYLYEEGRSPDIIEPLFQFTRYAVERGLSPVAYLAEINVLAKRAMEELKSRKNVEQEKLCLEWVSRITFPPRTVPHDNLCVIKRSDIALLLAAYRGGKVEKPKDWAITVDFERCKGPGKFVKKVRSEDKCITWLSDYLQHPDVRTDVNSTDYLQGNNLYRLLFILNSQAREKTDRILPASVDQVYAIIRQLLAMRLVVVGEEQATSHDVSMVNKERDADEYRWENMKPLYLELGVNPADLQRGQDNTTHSQPQRELNESARPASTETLVGAADDDSRLQPASEAEAGSGDVVTTPSSAEAIAEPADAAAWLTEFGAHPGDPTGKNKPRYRGTWTWDAIDSQPESSRGPSSAPVAAEDRQHRDHADASASPPPAGLPQGKTPAGGSSRFFKRGPQTPAVAPPAPKGNNQPEGAASKDKPEASSHGRGFSVKFSRTTPPR